MAEPVLVLTGQAITVTAVTETESAQIMGIGLEVLFATEIEFAVAVTTVGGLQDTGWGIPIGV